MTTRPTDEQINNAYAIAKERYAALKVDTDQALATLIQIPISLHCWQAMTWAVLRTPTVV